MGVLKIILYKMRFCVLKINESLLNVQQRNDEWLFFKGIPSFSPEIFKEIQNDDPMKSKQLEKGLNQLTDEGVAQLFTLSNRLWGNFLLHRSWFYL